MISADNGMGHILFSKEGVSHGYPLAMIIYGLGIISCIWDLQKAHPDVNQPWYADDTRVGSTLMDMQRNLYNLMLRGTLQGNLPDLTKSILIMSTRNVCRSRMRAGGS